MEKMKCNICPRECGADRENGQLGVCGASNKIFIARAALHMWEEPCISGEEGSGAVFFTGCPLGCVYCQNYEISRENSKKCEGTTGKRGTEVSVRELASIFIRLQDEKANNINLVTPTHYSYQIIEAITIARVNGLTIPIVYNCSGYEKKETLEALAGYVDVYLTDFKYMDERLAASYSKAADYAEVVKVALDEMVKQCGKPVFDDRGIMRKGVIVRNLLLPGNVKNSKEVADYVYNKYGNMVYLSIMNQYTPLKQVENMPPLNRKVTKREYNRLVDYVLSIGAENVFIQEGDVAKESFIPDFE